LYKNSPSSKATLQPVTAEIRLLKHFIVLAVIID